MKNVFKIFSIALVFAMFACGSGANQQDQEAASDEAVSPDMEQIESVPEETKPAEELQLQLQKPAEEKKEQELQLQLQRQDKEEPQLESRRPN